MVIVLGIDPGTANLGYGVVLARGRKLAALDGGVVTAPASEPLERRLARIHARLCDLIAEHQPSAVAVEDLFFGQNARTAFAVGQARGVVMLSAGLAGLPCYSYTPQAVKAAVCGSGAADKQQVQRMVGALLALPQRTPWRWPSVTRTAPRCGRRSDDRLPARTRPGAPARERRRRVRWRRLPDRRLGPHAAARSARREGGLPPFTPDHARRRDAAVRLRERGRARPVPDAHRRPGRRSQDGAGGPQRRLHGRAAQRDRRRRLRALPG